MKKISLYLQLFYIAISSALKIALTGQRLAKRDYLTELNFTISKRLINASKNRPITWLREAVIAVKGHCAELKQVRFEKIEIANVPCHWCHLKQESADDAGDSIIVYLHGGGYLIGCLEQYAPLVSSIAAHSKTPTLFVDYRLGPEFPFPAAQQDCLAVVSSIIEQYPDKKIILMGDSAGGGLCINSLAMLAKQNTATKVAGCVLISPYVTPLDTSPSIRDNADTDILDHELTRGWYDLFKVDMNNAQGHQLSFCELDLSFMPPTYVQAATGEILIDQINTFIKQAHSCGVTLEQDIFTGLFHDFQIFHPLVKDATKAIEMIANKVNTFK